MPVEPDARRRASAAGLVALVAGLAVAVSHAESVAAGVAFVLVGLAAAALLAWRAPRVGLLLTCASAPASLAWGFGGHNLTLPFEGLLLVALPVGLLRVAPRHWLRLARADAVFALALGAWLAWTWLTASASVAPLVSLKSAALRTLTALTLYFGVLLHARRPQARLEPLVAYVCGLLPVLAFTLARHGLAGFARPASYVAAQPFFSNRLDLLALLTLLLPVALAALVGGVRGSRGRAFALLLAGAAVLSVTLSARSFWVALGSALVVLPLAASRLRPSVSVAGLAVAAAALACLGADVLVYRSANMRAASPPARRVALYDALLALPSLRDDSVTERANRWACALRMAREQPGLGFGPNTFERLYARFQKHEEATAISTWQGDRGDAHSELLTALAEQGLPGLLALLFLFAAALRAGLRAARPGAPLGGALAAALGAWAVLNAFNAFLDLDKVAPSFWMLCALAVASAPADRRGHRIGSR